MNKTYRIEISLKTAVVCSLPVLLDGVIARAYLEAKGLLGLDSPVVLPSIYDFAADTEFPLAKSKCGSYFLASYLYYQGKVTEQQKGFRKSFPMAKAYLLNDKEKAKGVDIQRGEFRSVNDNLTTKTCSKLVGWFVGDLDKVKSLFELVSHIGKKSSIGYGEVSKVEFFEEEEIGFETHHLRPIPMQEAYHERKLAGRLIMLRTMPPYHQKQGEQPCMIPNNFIV